MGHHRNVSLRPRLQQPHELAEARVHLQLVGLVCDDVPPPPVPKFVHPREVESHVWVQACNIGGIPKVFDGGHKGPHTAIVSRFDLLRDELIYLQGPG
eukprot:CAMPEP_0174384430 /NCGR_PEP_ID=MMETSP0811_2-20130205/125914_1 /TAXON_ID=73025 ORGANISM="Eutreptiella gymnastica-like, Strain CCMP1594" /NCGR_SAMPLE_ID=MMETSP0811_2 /ASSEMBLY_ACC=CAM_ASM_000667 /LENGTH=97 /DNA_ID=CAMNT_0015538387 /DNA_START=1238 /DNA_END=1527 /DNA_ORIENTATION=+